MHSVNIHMPHFPWQLMQLTCRSCENHSGRRDEGDRWIALDRDALRELEATELHCRRGVVILCIPLGALEERFPTLKFHTFHEVAVVWDTILIDRRPPYLRPAADVQDLEGFELMKPLGHQSRGRREDDRYGEGS